MKQVLCHIKYGVSMQLPLYCYHLNGRGVSCSLAMISDKITKVY